VQDSVLKAVVDCPIRFGGRENSLTFDVKMLQRQLCMPYRDLAALLETSAIALLPLQGQRISARLEMLFRRALLANTPIAYADQIARQYGKSGPTLRRHLIQEGTTFRGLLNRCRMQRAAELLADTNLSVEQIAHQLSFSTASGFSRAFKGWTGLPPVAYRNPQRPGLMSAPRSSDASGRAAVAS
jgi:AraC-like DNA-binding protein